MVGRRTGGSQRNTLILLYLSPPIEAIGNLDFVAPDLVFVALDLAFVAPGLVFVAADFDSVAGPPQVM
jgi:hypothetical protein